MKLARNMLTFTSYAAACEAQRLAYECGLDIAALGKVVRHTDAITGGPGAIMVRDKVGPMEPDDFFYQPFLHPWGLGEKDLKLALALGRVNSVDLPLAEVAVTNLAAGLGVPQSASISEE
jgi:3-hydroxyisobutyrate dehydrogenase-like beta-hydroxyacid dehydrogenase